VSTEAILFYIFGALAVISALGMILNLRNIVASAMCLVGTMVCLGAIYLLLGAYLVAAIQIMVYGGAIVVLFLFVVMLLNLATDEFPPAGVRVTKIAVMCAAGIILARVIPALCGNPDLVVHSATLPEGFGGYRQVGIALYTDYVLLVEMVSLLLLAAIVGALVLAKRKID
jgi:NADH-quinone oxidoreductase subunit J